MSHESQITGHESWVTSHKSRVTNHESQIKIHESRVTNHKSQVTKQKSQVTSHKSRVTRQITNQITKHKSQVTNHESQITNHESRAKTSNSSVNLHCSPGAYQNTSLHSCMGLQSIHHSYCCKSYQHIHQYNYIDNYSPRRYKSLTRQCEQSLVTPDSQSIKWTEKSSVISCYSIPFTGFSQLKLHKGLTLETSLPPAVSPYTNFS